MPKTYMPPSKISFPPQIPQPPPPPPPPVPPADCGLGIRAKGCSKCPTGIMARDQARWKHSWYISGTRAFEFNWKDYNGNIPFKLKAKYVGAKWKISMNTYFADHAKVTWKTDSDGITRAEGKEVTTEYKPRRNELGWNKASVRWMVTWNSRANFGEGIFSVKAIYFWAEGEKGNYQMEDITTFNGRAEVYIKEVVASAGAKVVDACSGQCGWHEKAGVCGAADKVAEQRFDDDDVEEVEAGSFSLARSFLGAVTCYDAERDPCAESVDVAAVAGSLYGKATAQERAMLPPRKTMLVIKPQLASALEQAHTADADGAHHDQAEISAPLDNNDLLLKCDYLDPVGAAYRGSKAEAWDGSKCLPWPKKWAVIHHGAGLLKDPAACSELRPNLQCWQACIAEQETNNFCRNPNDAPQPYCRTGGSEEEPVWSDCRLVLCDNGNCPLYT